MEEEGSDRLGSFGLTAASGSRSTPAQWRTSEDKERWLGRLEVVVFDGGSVGRVTSRADEWQWRGEEGKCEEEKMEEGSPLLCPREDKEAPTRGGDKYGGQ
jgi:hypothetical protein